MSTETKYCKRCNRTLPIEEFHKDKQIKGGNAFYCKDCMAEYGKKYRGTVIGIYNQIKSRNNHAKKHLFKISSDYFIEWHDAQSKICVYCDLPEEYLQIIPDAINNKTLRLSIDCVDNTLGYIEGNLVLSCSRCNYTKSDLFTFDEMRKIGQEIIKPKWQKKKKILFPIQLSKN